MATPRDDGATIVLTTAAVVGVTEEVCTAWSASGVVSVPFALQFPAPRIDRVSPGHLVAVATGPDGRSAVVWRWYDVVILDDSVRDRVRAWEPGHGEITARANELYQPRVPGSRAYASAGLRGDEWWLSGPVVEDPADAAVELHEVRALYDLNDLWSSAFGGNP